MIKDPELISDMSVKIDEYRLDQECRVGRDYARKRNSGKRSISDKSSRLGHEAVSINDEADM